MPFCSAIENNLFVNLQGSKKLCCRTQKDMFEADKVRKIMNGGKKFEWSNQCSRCMKEEQAGFESLRQRYNQTLSGTPGRVEALEYIMSNECNLACRMCSTPYSTGIQKLFKDHDMENVPEAFVSNWSQVGQLTIDIEEFGDLSNLRQIKASGGEPLMSKMFYKLTDHLEKIGVLENVLFEMVTNGTVYSEKVIKELKKYKTVRLSVSIDGIGPLNDYIRFGSKFETVEKNIKKYIDHGFEVNIKHLQQAYNLHQKQEVIDWCDDKGYNLHYGEIEWPYYLGYKALPPAYAQKYGYTGDYNPQLNAMFVQYTKIYDKKTNMDIKNYLPELASLL